MVKNYYVYFIAGCLALVFTIKSCAEFPDRSSLDKEEVEVEVIANGMGFIVESSKPVVLEYLGESGHKQLCTHIYELDGYTYRIFWLGNGYDEGTLYVINLDKQELEMNLLKK